MNCKLVIHTDRCISRFDPRYRKAQQFLDSEVLRCSAPFVPMRSGDLMRSGNTGTKLGSGKVIYNVPYAKRIYYGLKFHFSTDKHPQACAQWFEKAKAIHLKNWINGVKTIIRKG